MYVLKIIGFVHLFATINGISYSWFNNCMYVHCAVQLYVLGTHFKNVNIIIEIPMFREDD
jgi:hypothetical protein